MKIAYMLALGMEKEIIQKKHFHISNATVLKVYTELFNPSPQEKTKLEAKLAQLKREMLLLR